MGEEAGAFEPGYSVEQTGEREFAARFPYSFGGLTLAAATLVAARTCDAKMFQSSHMWFLRQVPVDTTLKLNVEHIKDGRTLSHRRVRVSAEDRPLCELTASFATPNAGVAFQAEELDAMPPMPEDLPTEAETAEEEGWDWWEAGAIDWRYVDKPMRFGTAANTRWDGWARPLRPLIDEPAEHAAAIAFMSDNHSDWSSAHRIDGFKKQRYASLDNSVWLHRRILWDDWWLVRTVCDVAFDGTMFSRRKIYTRDGQLIGTWAQNAMYLGEP